MAAQQALPSLGFSKQEYWSGLPFPMHKSEMWKWSRSVCSTLSDPMDCSLPDSSVHGIVQARVLEWVAIAFSINEVKKQLLDYIIRFRDTAYVKVKSSESYTRFCRHQFSGASRRDQIGYWLKVEVIFCLLVREVTNIWMIPFIYITEKG